MRNMFIGLIRGMIIVVKLIFISGLANLLLKIGYYDRIAHTSIIIGNTWVYFKMVIDGRVMVCAYSTSKYWPGNKMH